MSHNYKTLGFVLFYGILLILIASTHSCSKDKAMEMIPPPPIDTTDTTDSMMSMCDSAAISYDLDIKMIVASNCAKSGCHDMSSAQGGVILETFMEVKDETQNGKLMCAIKHECSTMPSGNAKLADSIIQKFDCWIENGLLEKTTR